MTVSTKRTTGRVRRVAAYMTVRGTRKSTVRVITAKAERGAIQRLGQTRRLPGPVARKGVWTTYCFPTRQRVNPSPHSW